MYIYIYITILDKRLKGKTLKKHLTFYYIYTSQIENVNYNNL